jgi:hypothetical protein
MRPSDVTRLLEAVLRADRPLFLWGPPGVGKSELVRQAAAGYGEYLDFRPVYHDASDLKFPVVDTRSKSDPVRWVNSVFPRDPHWVGVIAIEELPQAQPLMQAALMQLVLDRRVGDYAAPAGARFVACGNRREDRAGAGHVLTPVLNRFCHVDVDVSVEDWQAWAAAQGLRPEVRAFLNYRPALLHQFDPASGARAFPSPRSWHMASDILPHLPAGLLLEGVAGAVGEAAAVEFIGFLEVWQGLPDIDAVLARPAGWQVPSNHAVLYALSGALADRARSLDAAGLGRLIQCSGRLPAEFDVLTVRDAMACVPDRKVMFAAPGMSAWLQKNKGVLGVQPA